MSTKHKLRVDDIINFREGTPHKASDFLELDEGRVIELRRELSSCHKTKEKFLVCAYCLGALCLKGGSDQSNKQRLHFFHLNSNDSEQCPLRQEKQLSKDEMRALIYKGAKESPCHKKMKEAIGHILLQDSRCRDVYIDELYKSRLPEERYKPDVQGYFLDKNIIFEIQISSDFITVILNREDYYQKKKAYLLWIFNKFSSKSGKQTLAQKDIYYGNNRNAFCLTQECVKMSHEYNELYLEVHYEVPQIVDGKIVNIEQQPRIVSMKEITFDNDFNAYFFDYKNAYKKAYENIIRDKIWIELKEKMYSDSNDCEIFICKMCGLNFDNSNAKQLIQYLLSATKEKPIHFDCENNKTLYSNLLNRKNRVVKTFFCYFHAIARDTKFYQDISDKLKEKIKNALVEIQEHGKEADFYPDKRYEPVLQKLFPVAYHKYQRLMDELHIL